MEKMTNVKAIEYVIAECEVPTEVREKLEKMKASFIKKNSRDKKPTAKQVENDKLKNEILSYMEINTCYTIGELIKLVPSCNEFSPQKMSALLKQLKDIGSVERIEDKRKVTFKRVV